MVTKLRQSQRRQLNKKIYSYLLNSYPDVSEGMVFIEDTLEEAGLYCEGSLITGEEGSIDLELYQESLEEPDWVTIDNAKLIVMWQKMDSGRIVMWNAYIS